MPTSGAARSPVAVLLLVIGAELARLERAPPGLVLAVPAHGGGQRVRERMARAPAELMDLARVERVPAIVAGPVRDGPDQALRLVGQAQDPTGEVHVLDLGAATDVVDLAVLPLAQDEVDGR